MQQSKADFEAQLRRQSLWLKDSMLWLLEKRLPGRGTEKPTALDVGCGPGFVMDALSPLLRARGVDKDPDMVESCRRRGLDAVLGDAYDLPFDDGTFEVVHCSFLMLWLQHPEKALSEMKRVSRSLVACLAEPDYGGQLNFPASIEGINALLVDGLKREGADPFVGRKLRSLFAGCGLEADIGVHPGVWDIERLRAESSAELRWIEIAAEAGGDTTRFHSIKSEWEKAAASGELFQFNPIFYAFARK